MSGIELTVRTLVTQLKSDDERRALRDRLSATIDAATTDRILPVGWGPLDALVDALEKAKHGPQPAGFDHLQVVLAAPVPKRRRPVDVALVGLAPVADRKQPPTAAVLLVTLCDWSEIPPGRRNPLVDAAEAARLHRDFCGAFTPEPVFTSLVLLPGLDAQRTDLLVREYQELSGARADCESPELVIARQGNMDGLLNLLRDGLFRTDDRARGEAWAHDAVREFATTLTSAMDLPGPDLFRRGTRRLAGPSEYNLTDEQSAVLSEVTSEIEDLLKKRKLWLLGKKANPVASAGNRTTIIVTGRPGTGKTVVGVELLRRALERQWQARYVSPVSSFNQSMSDALARGDSSLREMFGSTRTLRELSEPLDLLVVDESHRLTTYTDTQWTPKEDRGQHLSLDEIDNAAHVVVVLLDEGQRIRPTEIGTEAAFATYKNPQPNARLLGRRIRRYSLTKPLRSAGVQNFDDWLIRFLGIDASGDLLTHPREIVPWRPEHIREAALFPVYVAAKPADMERFVRRHDVGGATAAADRARILAGYSWRWTKAKTHPLPADVVVGDWSMPWNAAHGHPKADPPIEISTRWATSPYSVDQVGCVHTSQGFDFGWTGVLFGEDLVWRDDAWSAQSSRHHDRGSQQAARQTGDGLDTYIRRCYRVLLTRALFGSVVYSADPKTQDFFRTIFPPLDPHV